MASPVEFLVDNYEHWEEYKDVFVSGLNIFDNRLFNVLMGDLENRILVFRSIEEFLVEYVEKGGDVDWFYLSKNTNVSEPTIKAWIQEGKPVDWWALCQNPNISETTIEEWIQEGKPVDWSGLSRNSNLSVKFFKKYKDKLVWFDLLNNKLFGGLFIGDEEN